MALSINRPNRSHLHAHTHQSPSASLSLPKAAKQAPGAPMLPPQVSRPGGRNVVTEDASAWMSRAAMQKAKGAGGARRTSQQDQGGNGGGGKG